MGTITLFFDWENRTNLTWLSSVAAASEADYDGFGEIWDWLSADGEIELDTAAAAAWLAKARKVPGFLSSGVTVNDPPRWVTTAPFLSRAWLDMLEEFASYSLEGRRASRYSQVIQLHSRRKTK